MCITNNTFEETHIEECIIYNVHTVGSQLSERVGTECVQISEMLQTMYIQCIRKYRAVCFAKCVYILLKMFTC